MIAAAALVGVIVLMATGLTWAAHLVHVGNLDMQALADKLATPEPVSALDWPELLGARGHPGAGRRATRAA